MLKVTHSDVRQVGTDSVSLCRIHTLGQGRHWRWLPGVGLGKAGRNYKFKIVKSENQKNFNLNGTYIY